jgi:hypothetical protein
VSGSEGREWRLPAASRWSEGFLGVFLAAIALASVVTQPGLWLGWVLLVPAVVLLLGLRRACRLTDDTVVVQGRFVRRVVPLRDLRQVGLALGGRPWLQTHDDEVTLLRMVPLLDYGGGKASPALVDQLRSAAAAAGARLDPPLEGPQRPPTTKPLVLGI